MSLRKVRMCACLRVCAVFAALSRFPPLLRPHCALPFEAVTYLFFGWVAEFFTGALRLSAGKSGPPPRSAGTSAFRERRASAAVHPSSRHLPGVSKAERPPILRLTATFRPFA
jgi:hypothetical protein